MTLTKPKKRPRPPGRNIAESERHTEQVKLRLLPATKRALDALAAEWDISRSQAVTELVARYGRRTRG